MNELIHVLRYPDVNMPSYSHGRYQRVVVAYLKHQKRMRSTAGVIVLLVLWQVITLVLPYIALGMRLCVAARL